MGREKRGKPRRITAPVGEHGVHTTSPVTRLLAQSLHLLGSPAILMIQPDTVSRVSESGELIYADAIEVAVRGSGGKPLAVPPVLGSEPAPGWTATLDLSTDELLIHFPDGLVFYDGGLPTKGPWVPDVRKAGVVSVITGPIATIDDAETVILGGRASHVTVPITITG
ncbi:MULTISPECIES: hypothetical protein [Streptacidiphilus]|uniref:L,D-transpeptidase n=1 Tax=Streptacidiphilus cavernicola TaxID=3342716 RepID=A0ABV6UW52_9ACTN|nr:hypothetical protein [Streptacidiphilus jeojiense]